MITETLLVSKTVSLY